MSRVKLNKNAGKLKRGKVLRRGSDGLLRTYRLDKIEKNLQNSEESPKLVKADIHEKLNKLEERSSNESFGNTDSEEEPDVTHLHPNMVMF